MTIYLASITPRSTRPKSSASGDLVSDYIKRASRYSPVEQLTFSDEAALFTWIDKTKARTPAQLILLDSRGQTLSSEDFASALSRLRDEGTQRVVLAIGPASGWSLESKKRANLLFSLGRITLPHELAAAVLAEQVYRALTIVAGHPYHSGH